MGENPPTHSRAPAESHRCAATTVKAGNSQPGWFTCTATKCRADTCKLHFSCLWIYVLPSHFVNSETWFKPDIILSPQSAKLTACTFLVPPEELIHFQTLSPAAVWSYTKTQFPQIRLLCSAFPVAPQLEILPVKTPRLANLTSVNQSQTLIRWMSDNENDDRFKHGLRASQGEDTKPPPQLPVSQPAFHLG